MWWTRRKAFFYSLEIAGFVFFFCALLGPIGWPLAMVLILIGYVGRMLS